MRAHAQRRQGRPIENRAKAVAIAMLASVSLISPSDVGAQPLHSTFQHGDILAGGQTPSQIGFAFGRLDWFLPNGDLNQRLASTFDELPQDVLLDRTGRAYWATGLTVRVFDNTGVFAGNFPAVTGEFIRMTIDRPGNLYLGGIRGGSNLTKVSPEGDLLASFTVPFEAPSGGVLFGLDLATDQCTIHYTTGGRRVFRYDVCRSMPLADLNSDLPGIQAWNLRILPEGEVVVSNLDSLLRLNRSGDVVMVYDIAGEHSWKGIALDVDRTSIWATSRNTAFKFDIASGSLLNSFQSSDYIFNTVTVVGEPRAALGGESIPTLSEWSILALVLGLALVAAVRLRV